jgi:hypothetical protein
MPGFPNRMRATSELISRVPVRKSGNRQAGRWMPSFQELVSYDARCLPMLCLDIAPTGTGTGGTLSGTAKFLRRKKPGIRVVLSDPEGSGLFNKVKYGVMFDMKEKEGRKRRHQVDTIVSQLVEMKRISLANMNSETQVEGIGKFCVKVSGSACV